MASRSYSELVQYHTLEDRWRYLSLRGQVGDITFGHERWINQRFYKSREWRQIRHYVVDRDRGCDLGIEGYDIHANLVVHHMNPMAAEDITHGDGSVLDPEFLITTSHQTHNAIHYGDIDLLPRPFVPRRPGDTKLW